MSRPTSHGSASTLRRCAEVPMHVWLPYRKSNKERHSLCVLCANTASRAMSGKEDALGKEVVAARQVTEVSASEVGVHVKSVQGIPP